VECSKESLFSITENSLEVSLIVDSASVDLFPAECVSVGADTFRALQVTNDSGLGLFLSPPFSLIPPTSISPSSS
jgi:hypothetical protein